MSVSYAIPTADTASSPRLANAASVVADAERFARLRLIRSKNVGPRTYAHLMRRYITASRALEAIPNLAARGGSDGYVVCTASAAQAEIDAAADMGARMVQLGDPAYPALLAAIDAPPPVLWVKGDLSLFERSAIAVVGARNASALGLRTARRLSRELGALNHVVVSGLARGIDAAAHDAALESGTIAVLAGGLDSPYPPENRDLYNRIAESGVLVSEIPFGVAPTGKHFPRRNRIISGLAQGVVLIEAASRSGSLITARFALEQGREAMACPGAPEDPRAAGCNALIRDGAALIRHAGDIEEAIATPPLRMLAEEGGEFDFDAELFGDNALRDDLDALSDFDEEGRQDTDALADQVMSLVGSHPVEVDEIARQCGTSPQDLSVALLELDLAGRIDLLPGGMIVRTGA